MDLRRRPLGSQAPHRNRVGGPSATWCGRGDSRPGSNRGTRGAVRTPAPGARGAARVAGLRAGAGRRGRLPGGRASGSAGVGSGGRPTRGTGGRASGGTAGRCAGPPRLDIRRGAGGRPAARFSTAGDGGRIGPEPVGAGQAVRRPVTVSTLEDRGLGREVVSPRTIGIAGAGDGATGLEGVRAVPRSCVSVPRIA